MIEFVRLSVVTLLGGLLVVSSAYAQEERGAKASPVLDGSDINQQLIERQQKIDQLSEAERAKLQAAYTVAFEDPLVKAAIAARAKAIEDYQAALYKSMVASDPAVEALLQKRAELAKQQ